MRKNKIVLVIIGLISLSVIFYWFEIRPANIRKHCSDLAPLDTAEAKNLLDKDAVDQEIRVLELSSAVYTNCLHEKGLQK